MAITRRGFMGISAAAATAALQARAAAPAERYNVVVLIVDEHNPRYSALHGHPLAETPNLRRMMERGTAYLNCYCPSPLCAPSRSSFLSGLRVHQHRHYSNCNSVRQEHPTYAQALSAQGVHPVHAGKADFYLPVGEAGFTEVIRGWDRHPPGDLAISRKPLAVRTGDGAVRARSFGPVDRNPWDDDDTVISDSLAWLKEKAPQLDKPFTLVVNTNAPHFPHWVTPELWEKYAAGADLPAHGVEAASAQHPYAQDLRAHFETHVFTEEQVRGQRRGYLGCVDYADRLAGRFLDLLDTTGLAANTIFIYTSDHGEMLGKFGMWWKSSLYEDSAQVPLVAVGPGIPAGRRVSTPVDLHDVNATLFAATGATRPNAWQGVPLQQIPEDDKGRILFSEYHGHGTRGSAYLIRRGPWKLIWYAEAPHQLFHLDEDPEELHNLAESARPEFRELEAALFAICDPARENVRTEEWIAAQLASTQAPQG